MHLQLLPTLQAREAATLQSRSPPGGIQGCSQIARRVMKQEEGPGLHQVLGLPGKLPRQVSTEPTGPRSLQLPGPGSPGSYLCAGHTLHMGTRCSRQGRLCPRRAVSACSVPAHPGPPPPIHPMQLQASEALFESTGPNSHTASLPGAHHLWYGPIQLPGSSHLPASTLVIIT